MYTPPNFIHPRFHPFHAFTRLSIQTSIHPSIYISIHPLFYSFTLPSINSSIHQLFHPSTPLPPTLLSVHHSIHPCTRPLWSSLTEVTTKVTPPAATYYARLHTHKHILTSTHSHTHKHTLTSTQTHSRIHAHKHPHSTTHARSLYSTFTNKYKNTGTCRYPHDIISRIYMYSHTCNAIRREV